MQETLEVAGAVGQDQLQESIDTLRARANALDAEANADGLDVPAIRDLGRKATSLRDAAGALVGKQIDLMAGDLAITAENINAAVQAADDVIQAIADTKVKLKKVAALVEFLGAVTAGNGPAVLKAAGELKKALA